MNAKGSIYCCNEMYRGFKGGVYSEVLCGFILLREKKILGTMVRWFGMGFLLVDFRVIYSCCRTWIQLSKAYYGGASRSYGG